ncbi:sugar-binding transcriptional regulator [Cognatishimia sp. WU-CL00825]|uniref:sugar-binding transcriptional regulator n=1 Tax=Cognatishimia sp. WU-CL00825 TaxID=3127658 RepID=UPI003105D323
MRSDSSNRLTDKDAQLANVAILYYGEGLTQSEIAKRMGVSRPTVVNMLRDSRERGIVEIRVDSEVLSSSSLSRALCAKFDLQDVYIARAREPQKRKSERSELLSQVARVAGMAIQDIVSSGDTVGVAWGETIKSVSMVMTRNNLHDVTVCQMIGSMVSDRVPTSEDCAIRIANYLNAECYTLHAPAVLSSAKLAEQITSEPTIAAQLSRLRSLDVAIFSVGNIRQDTHLVAAGIASGEELDAAVASGANGIVCGRYIDRSGQALGLPPENRLVAIEISDLRAAKKKFLVAAGDDRLDAVHAAIMGKLVTHLCIDEALAELLLAHSE